MYRTTRSIEVCRSPERVLSDQVFCDDAENLYRQRKYPFRERSCQGVRNIWTRRGRLLTSDKRSSGCRASFPLFSFLFEMLSISVGSDAYWLR